MMIGEATLGSKWRARSRLDVAPRLRADSMKASSRTAMTSPRSRRTKPGTNTMAIAMRGVVDVGAQQRRHGQGEDQWREREEGVHRAHDHRIDGTPEEPGDQTKRDGNQGSQTDDLETTLAARCGHPR